MMSANIYLGTTTAENYVSKYLVLIVLRGTGTTSKVDKCWHVLFAPEQFHDFLTASNGISCQKSIIFGQRVPII